ncbi:MAG: Cytidylate kinase [uncultured bacterium]|nr:MAG: Cytidylate kinase [uncultured bacterium]
MIITIDGPTASGKSTVGRLLAKRLNSYYLYTGLLYRAVAYRLMKDHGYTIETIAHPDMLIIDQLLDSKRFVYQYTATDRERIFYDGVDITNHLQDDTIGQGASIVSTHPEVRERLNQLQRAIANDHDVVIDGRDSGSVVFPHAQHKFFLTASEDERIVRWCMYQEKLGHMVTMEQAKLFISSRDQRDSTRKIAPLSIPIGALVIDNTGKSVSETLELITRYLP